MDLWLKQMARRSGLGGGNVHLDWVETAFLKFGVILRFEARVFDGSFGIEERVDGDLVASFAIFS